MSKVCLRGVLMGLLACVVSAQAQPDHPLTLPEVLQLAHSRNPSLASQALQLEATKANEVTARLRVNPELSISKEDLSLSSLAQVDETFNVSRLFERGNKRRYRIESASLATVVAKHTYDDFERQLMLNVKQSFVALLLAKANLQLAEQNRQDYAKTVELSSIRFSAGEISRTELDRIELQASRFETDALNATQAMAQARTQLESLIGLDDFSSTFDIAGELTVPNIRIDRSKLQEQALAARPDYLAALEQVHKSEADIKLADANGATDVVAGAEYKRNGPDNFTGVTLGIPLRFFDRNQGEKLRTRRVLDASRATERAARIQVLSDLNQALAALDSAQRIAQLYNSDYLTKAKQVRERVEFSYRHGATSLLDYIQALREYRDTELAWRTSTAQLLNAIHQLSFVTGTELLP
ncbi:MAG TPA: TolC family protein [Candidatus Angelobacter sp.]|nr:TolC family protein [Candidatus Angelobacter sp.]